jgi:hypothetical protein
MVLLPFGDWQVGCAGVSTPLCAPNLLHKLANRVICHSFVQINCL